jgi:hypothetical protein
MTITDARAFVGRHHRHHRPPVGGIFAVGVEHDGAVIGVAIVGRPVARAIADDWTAEVTRVAVIDGAPTGACSKLYAACWRAARAMGYRRIITYTLQSERGTSIWAAGWKCVGETSGGSWHRERRPRVDRHPTEPKFRWEQTA